MTPQERQLVDDLFDRLAKLESMPREPDAEAAITQGLRRAPNAVYALVQTALVQDEALKRANARIQELEGGEQEPRPSGGFLDSMRDAILGSEQAGPGQSRGSVPNVRPGDGAQRGPVWNSGQALEQADARIGQDPRNNDPRMNDPRFNDPRSGNPGGGLFGGGNPGGGGGGSFLGTAAATAAGVIGGSMLMNSIKGLMGGGGGQQSLGNTADAGGSKMPWDNSSSSGNLARDAGVNDVGKGGTSQPQSSYDQAQADADQDQDQDQDDDDDYDSGDDDGDSDFA